jgi:hypothetical protein
MRRAAKRELHGVAARLTPESAPEYDEGIFDVTIRSLSTVSSL